MSQELVLDGVTYNFTDPDDNQKQIYENLRFAQQRMDEIRKMRDLLETSKNIVIRELKNEILSVKAGLILED